MRVVIAGGGQVATLIARRLVREGNEVVVVEERAERCGQLQDLLDAKIVQGNATRVATLRRCGLGETGMFIAATNSDESNLLSCMIAQSEAAQLVKIARIRTHEVEQWRRVCEQVGLQIDLIVHPESRLTERIMRVVGIPGVSDIYDFAGGEVKLFGMNVDAASWFNGKTLEELDASGPPKNSLIALIFRGQQVIIPHGEEQLRTGDHIYVMATRANLAAVLGFMGLEQQDSVSRVFIVGGKQLGIGVAEALEKRGVSVKLFEQDGPRCEKISTILAKTVVIHGDGTDQTTLEEENIGGIDAFFALNPHDEDNIIASLLARRLGAKKVVPLINRLNYLPMVQRLGINTSVSPRLEAVDRVLQFVRKGRVLSVTTFREEEAEAIELIASPGSKYVGKHLRDIRFPRGAIVGAIARPTGEVTIPRGEATIQAGDRVIFFTLESVVPELENAFLNEPTRQRKIG
jgi:trk system potassium uptake protein TrkA